MERRIIEFSEFDDARVVVALGQVGRYHARIAGAMRSDSGLLAIDLDSAFNRIVAAIDDPRLISHTGSATELAEILRQHGLASADVVISGIPLLTMPDSVGTAVLEAARDSLSTNGVFVA